MKIILAVVILGCIGYVCCEKKVTLKAKIEAEEQDWERIKVKFEKGEKLDDSDFAKLKLPADIAVKIKAGSYTQADKIKTITIITTKQQKNKGAVKISSEFDAFIACVRGFDKPGQKQDHRDRCGQIKLRDEKTLLRIVAKAGFKAEHVRLAIRASIYPVDITDEIVRSVTNIVASLNLDDLLDNLVGDLTGILGDAVTGIVAAIGKLDLNKVTDIAVNAAAQIIQVLGSVASQIVCTILQFLTQVVNQVLSVLSQILGTVCPTLSGLIGQLSPTVVDLLQQVIKVVGDLVEKITEITQGLGSVG